jgi:hypothetical protein
MRSLNKLSVALTTIVGFALAACSDDDEHSDDHQAAVPECEAIFDACHRYDDGNPGPIHDCHELGHEGTKEQCVAATENCLELCSAPDGGDGG